MKNIRNQNSNQPVLEFLKRIAIPRFPGTNNLKKIQAFIEHEFRLLKRVSVKSQNFTVSRWYMSYLLNIVHPVLGCLMIAIFFLSFFSFYKIALSMSVILFFLTLFNRQIIYFLQFRIQKYGKQIPARNIIAEIPSVKEPKEHIIFVAHSDSISHRLSPVLEALGYFAGFIGGFVFSIHSIVINFVYLFNPSVSSSIWQLIWGLAMGCFTFIELFNTKGNNSIGLLDDATGVALLYHLAHYINHHPLNHLKVTFLITDAEELGDYGAYYYIKDYHQKLPKETTRFLIVDWIGSSGTNKIIKGIGVPIRHFSLKLEKWFQKTLNQYQPPLNFMRIPPLLQFATDHVPIDKYGYEFLIFSSTDFCIHGEADNWKNFSEKEFIEINEYIQQSIKDYDIFLSRD